MVDALDASDILADIRDASSNASDAGVECNDGTGSSSASSTATESAACTHASYGAGDTGSPGCVAVLAPDCKPVGGVPSRLSRRRCPMGDRRWCSVSC